MLQALVYSSPLKYSYLKFTSKIPGMIVVTHFSVWNQLAIYDILTTVKKTYQTNP